MFDKKMTLEKYFYDNRDYFDKLVWYYKGFKNGFYKEQRKMIKEYRTRVCEKTGTKCGKGKGEWWVYSYGRVLGTYIKKEAPRIGIECVFEGETSSNPFGEFHIYVATWDKPDFGDYKMDIDKYFPNKKDRGTEKREFRLVELASNNQDVIINTLSDTYNTLKGIINSKDA